MLQNQFPRYYDENTSFLYNQLLNVCIMVMVFIYFWLIKCVFFSIQSVRKINKGENKRREITRFDYTSIVQNQIYPIKKPNCVK